MPNDLLLAIVIGPAAGLTLGLLAALVVMLSDLKRDGNAIAVQRHNAQMRAIIARRTPTR